MRGGACSAGDTLRVLQESADSLNPYLERAGYVVYTLALHDVLIGCRFCPLRASATSGRGSAPIVA